MSKTMLKKKTHSATFWENTVIGCDLHSKYTRNHISPKIIMWNTTFKWPKFITCRVENKHKKAIFNRQMFRFYFNFSAKVNFPILYLSTREIASNLKVSFWKPWHCFFRGPKFWLSVFAERSVFFLQTEVRNQIVGKNRRVMSQNFTLC